MNNGNSRRGDDGDVDVLYKLHPVTETQEDWSDTLDCEGGI